MSLLIALDTCAIIKLIEDAEQRTRFETAVRTVDAKLLIPAPALAELLVVADQQRETLAEAFRRAGRVPTFSEASASICAELHRQNWADRPDAVARPQFKVDLMIAACAVEQRCHALLSEDEGSRKAVQGTHVMGWTIAKAITELSPPQIEHEPTDQGKLL